MSHTLREGSEDLGPPERHKEQGANLSRSNHRKTNPAAPLQARSLARRLSRLLPPARSCLCSRKLFCRRCIARRSRRSHVTAASRGHRSARSRIHPSARTEPTRCARPGSETSATFLLPNWPVSNPGLLPRLLSLKPIWRVDSSTERNNTIHTSTFETVSETQFCVAKSRP